MSKISWGRSVEGTHPGTRYTNGERTATSKCGYFVIRQHICDQLSSQDCKYSLEIDR